MTKDDCNFEGWLAILQLNLLDEGINHKDKAEARACYDSGDGLYDAPESIKDEYQL